MNASSVRLQLALGDAHHLRCESTSAAAQRRNRALLAIIRGESYVGEKGK
jgi:hypothetical protein